MIVAALLDQLQRRADRPVAGNVQAGLFLDEHDEDVRLGVVSGAGYTEKAPEGAPSCPDSGGPT